MRLNSRWTLMAIAVGLLGSGAGVLALNVNAPHIMLAQAFDMAQTEQKTVTVEDVLSGNIKPVMMIDVRRYDEYAQDHIANSSVVPLSEIEEGEGVEKVQLWIEHAELTMDEQPTVILYCSSGRRSGLAQQILADSGIESYNLDGGIQAWRAAISPEQDAEALNF
ncbi:MAG: rhodanese-like domain-containing protein [Elainellaceae cyanobacterium]